MNAAEIKLLKDIREHFDQIGDGADDASYAGRMALNFTEPLDRLLGRLDADDGGAGYRIQTAGEMLYDDVARSTTNALIGIAISLREIATKL